MLTISYPDQLKLVVLAYAYVSKFKWPYIQNGEPRNQDPEEDWDEISYILLNFFKSKVIINKIYVIIKQFSGDILWLGCFLDSVYKLLHESWKKTFLWNNAKVTFCLQIRICVNCTLDQINL